MCLAAAYWARLSRVVFANDRHDAAAIGFDDESLYREIGLPPEARALPTEHRPHAGARQVFADWLANPDRIPY
jgi:tRNA(Arg) A34 adenosine deaminase TadA